MLWHIRVERVGVTRAGRGEPGFEQLLRTLGGCRLEKKNQQERKITPQSTVNLHKHYLLKVTNPKLQLNKVLAEGSSNFSALREDYICATSTVCLHTQVNEIPRWAWKINTLTLHGLGADSITLKRPIFSSLLNSTPFDVSAPDRHTQCGSYGALCLSTRLRLMFCLSYFHLFSRSKQLHLQYASSSAGAKYDHHFSFFVIACSVYQKAFNHWAVQVEAPLSLPAQRAYCDLACCILEHPGWFTTFIRDNSQLCTTPLYRLSVQEGFNTIITVQQSDNTESFTMW